MKIDLSKIDDLTEAQLRSLTNMLCQLVQLDADRAYYQNSAGFNADDTDIGHELCELALTEGLDQNHAKAAKELCFKYWRQLNENDFRTVYGRTYPEIRARAEQRRAARRSN